MGSKNGSEDPEEKFLLDATEGTTPASIVRSSADDHHFFRDPAMFKALKETVYPALLEDGRGSDPIRIWVPGCSTGEKVYSLAISLLEARAERRLHRAIQIFATDVSGTAIVRARAGAYPRAIEAHVSEDRLRRFFTRYDDHYQINRFVREICVFAKQDVINDPPFSRLDMINCRDVLIYFEPALQKRILPIFHYALNPMGFLVLGASETASPPSERFTIIDHKNKIYQKALIASAPAELPLVRPMIDNETPGGTIPRANDGQNGHDEIIKEADRLIMSRYAPAAVVVDAALQVVQLRGRTGLYLEPAPGEPDFNILKMARGGLDTELRAMLEEAQQTNRPARASGLLIRVNEQLCEISLEVIPLLDGHKRVDHEPDGRCFLVIFEEPVKASSPNKATVTAHGRQEISRERRAAELEQELDETRESMQAVIDEQDAANEALQTANENLVSSNEALQSINEELETAKEELEATNEELTAVNDELTERSNELSELTNLLASVSMPIVMLSQDLRIRRFTPQAQQVCRLIPADIGRDIRDINAKLVPDLERLLLDVIASAVQREEEVQGQDGRRYLMRVRPYRTGENRVDGAVLCFMDIDGVKKAGA